MDNFHLNCYSTNEIPKGINALFLIDTTKCVTWFTFLAPDDHWDHCKISQKQKLCNCRWHHTGHQLHWVHVQLSQSSWKNTLSSAQSINWHNRMLPRPRTIDLIDAWRKNNHLLTRHIKPIKGSSPTGTY